MACAVLGHFSGVRLSATPWTVAHQAPLSMGFSRQEYWRGLPCPTPGDLPYPGTEPCSLTSPALADGFFTTSASWEGPVGGAAESPRPPACLSKHSPTHSQHSSAPCCPSGRERRSLGKPGSPPVQADPPESPFLGAPWLRARSEHLGDLRGPARWACLSCARPSPGPPPPLVPSYVHFPLNFQSVCSAFLNLSTNSVRALLGFTRT